MPPALRGCRCEAYDDSNTAICRESVVGKKLNSKIFASELEEAGTTACAESSWFRNFGNFCQSPSLPCRLKTYPGDTFDCTLRLFVRSKDYAVLCSLLLNVVAFYSAHAWICCLPVGTSSKHTPCGPFRVMGDEPVCLHNSTPTHLGLQAHMYTGLGQACVSQPDRILLFGQKSAAKHVHTDHRATVNGSCRCSCSA